MFILLTTTLCLLFGLDMSSVVTLSLRLIFILVVKDVIHFVTCISVILSLFLKLDSIFHLQAICINKRDAGKGPIFTRLRKNEGNVFYRVCFCWCPLRGCQDKKLNSQVSASNFRDVKTSLDFQRFLQTMFFESYLRCFSRKGEFNGFVAFTWSARYFK